MMPAIGYPGGKRRLLKRLEKFFPVDNIDCYGEPFVGMGALYLHLRSLGYSGPSILADNSQEVMDFWRLAHDDSR